ARLPVARRTRRVAGAGRAVACGTGGVVGARRSRQSRPARRCAGPRPAAARAGCRQPAAARGGRDPRAARRGAGRCGRPDVGAPTPPVSLAAPGRHPGDRAPRTGFGQLLHLLGGAGFRRLFTVRVTSQWADGVFQVALASYVVLSPERAPSAWGIAIALAVVLLPFSVLGPFVGVFLDRWSRRQVLVRANLVRVPLLLVLAGCFAAGLDGPGLFLVVLA